MKDDSSGCRRDLGLTNGRWAPIIQSLRRASRLYRVFGARMPRKVIGDPKAGLALRIRQTADAMTLEGRPDPALLAVVVAVSLIAGVIGSIAGSPSQGVVSFVLFALLFSPLLTVLIFNALRIKTQC